VVDIVPAQYRSSDRTSLGRERARGRRGGIGPTQTSFHLLALSQGFASELLPVGAIRK
jgi:hypothetical protein